MIMLCECSSRYCNLSVDIPEQEYIEKEENEVVIVDKCKTGPDPTDIFVCQKEGYSLYREVKN